MWVLVASIILLIMAFAFRAYVISEEHYLDNLAFNPSSMSDCLKFSSDPHGKEASCIFRLAYIEKDETICSSLPNPLKISCMSSVAYEIGDWKFCLSYNDTKAKDHCLLDYQYGKDPGVCFAMTNLDFADRCFSEMGKKLNNVSLCTHVVQNKFSEKWYCVESVAVALLSPGICGMIPIEANTTCSPYPSESCPVYPVRISVDCYTQLAKLQKNSSICGLIRDSVSVPGYVDTEISSCVSESQ